MKKALIPLVILLIAAFVISGCSSSPTTTAPPATTAAAVPTSKPPTTTAAASPTVQPPPVTTAAAPPATKPPATTQAPPASKTPKPGGTLRFIQYTGPTSPGGWPADTGVQGSMAYEGLIQQQASGEFTPWLAASWDIAPDKKSITFKLQKGVKFTDGTDFNAAAVKFNYDAQMANKKAPYWDSVEVVDDYTVKVNMKQWRATAMMQFGDSTTAGIASPTAFNKVGLEVMRQNPVGTGAFILKKFTRDAQVEYVKNPNYRLAGKPYLDAYIDIVITQESTQKAAMQAKEGDATMCEMGKSSADYQKMGLIVDSAAQAVVSLVPDSANADSPWSKKGVREAAEYAIDREAIATGMGFGLWQAPYQLPPRGNPVYNPNFTGGRKFDLNKAKQLLADAGYPNGFKTALIPFPGAASRDACQAVQGALAKIGILAEPEFVDFGKYFAYSTDGWKNGLMFHPVPAYAYYIETINSLFDPDISLFFKKSWERTAAFKTALIAANNVLTPDIALTRAVSDLMIADAMVIPVHEGGKSYAYQSYVKDAGFLTRGFANSWNPERTWLDK